VASPRVLSELEGVCLGIVRKYDPCTAYHVRMKLKEAPSSHWKASSGSVYPLLSRLEDEGLIETAADTSDGRGRTLLSITRQGRASLKKWLVAGASQNLISSLTDPIRSRMFFLDALPAAQQATYLDKLEAEMERYLTDTERHLANQSQVEERYNYLGALGAVKLAEARLAWLRTVRHTLLSC